LDANALPKGHIIGWAPPPTSTSGSPASKPLSKSAKKNAKRKQRREEEKEKVDFPDNWEDDDNGSDPSPSTDSNNGAPVTSTMTTTAPNENQQFSCEDVADDLSSKLDKLNV